MGQGEPHSFKPNVATLVAVAIRHWPEPATHIAGLSCCFRKPILNPLLGPAEASKGFPSNANQDARSTSRPEAQFCHTPRKSTDGCAYAVGAAELVVLLDAAAYSVRNTILARSLRWCTSRISKTSSVEGLRALAPGPLQSGRSASRNSHGHDACAHIWGPGITLFWI